MPSEGSIRGQTYAAAGKNAKPLQNEGQKVISAITNQGEAVTTTWQVVEVNRPLMSVHQICAQGNIVVFGQDGGYVMSLNDNKRHYFGVEDNVYVMDLYLPPAQANSFRRQGPR